MTKVDLSPAIGLIRSVRGYNEIGIELEQLAAQNRIRVDANLDARAQTSLSGIITLGPEAIASSALSLAQTLVHEHYHLHQNPFLKTASFWAGVATRTPVMRRYEQPAYEMALDFLEAVKRDHPHLAREAEIEQNAVRCVFANDFGVQLE